MGYLDLASHGGYFLFYDRHVEEVKCYIQGNVLVGPGSGSVHLCYISVMELVLCFSVIYIVSYGSILVV